MSMIPQKFRAYILDEGITVHKLTLDSAHHYIDDGAIFVQYIDLKDKNGVEICAGDIIKTKRIYKDMEDVVGTVEYSNCQYILRYADKGFNNIAFANEYHEVIGNIYETPELLEGVSNE